MKPRLIFHLIYKYIILWCYLINTSNCSVKFIIDRSENGDTMEVLSTEKPKIDVELQQQGKNSNKHKCTNTKRRTIALLNKKLSCFTSDELRSGSLAGESQYCACYLR